MRKIKHFSPDEFTCNDVECYDLMSDELLVKLDLAREIAGVPFHINSSWRDRATNERVGGAKNSAHLRGTAVDISCGNSANRFKIVEACLTAGFTRIGIAKTFVHVDVDEELPECVIWTY